jgi:hypothetical protein
MKYVEKYNKEVESCFFFVEGFGLMDNDETERLFKNCLDQGKKVEDMDLSEYEIAPKLENDVIY